MISFGFGAFVLLRIGDQELGLIKTAINGVRVWFELLKFSNSLLELLVYPLWMIDSILNLVQYFIEGKVKDSFSVTKDA